MANASGPPFADQSNKDTTVTPMPLMVISGWAVDPPWFVHIRTRAEDRFITTHSNINHAAAKERRGNYDSLLLCSHLRKFYFKHWCPLLIHHYSSLPNPQCKAPSRSFISLHFTLIKTQCDSIGRVYLQKLFKSALKMNEPPPVLLSER